MRYKKIKIIFITLIIFLLNSISVFAITDSQITWGSYGTYSNGGYLVTDRLGYDSSGNLYVEFSSYSGLGSTFDVGVYDETGLFYVVSNSYAIPNGVLNTPYLIFSPLVSGHTYHESLWTGSKVTYNGPSLPSAPIGLSVSGSGGSGILSWASVSGSTSYNVYDGSNKITSGIVTNSYNFSNLSVGSHIFYVTAVNTTGESSKSSGFTYNVAPDSPVLSTSNITASSATISWNSVTGASSYDLSVNGSFVVNTTNSSYNLTQLNQKTSYSVSVIAKSSSGNSSPGSTSFTTLALPDPPTGLQATNITSSSVDLTWNSVDDSTSYILDQDGNVLASTSTNNYQITGLNPQTSYTFKVAVTTQAGQSTYSDPVTITTLGVPPVTPSGLSFDNLSTNGFTVYWLRQSDADSYNVYLNGTLVQNVSQTLIFNPSYTFSNLDANTGYNVTIIAVNAWGMSSASQPLTVTTISDPPSNLTASNITSQGVTLTWTGLKGALNYILDQNDNVIATTTDTTYNVTGLSPQTTYTFKVAVQTSAGQSDFSPPITVTTLGVPPVAPAGLSYSNLTDASFNAYWLRQNDATSYDVYLNGNLVGNVQQPLIYNPSYSFDNLSPNTTYTLTVIAKNDWGQSVASQPLTVTTLITPPNGLLRAKNITSNSVDFTWSALDGATSYAIAENGNLIAVVTGTSYTVTGLSPQTSYSFQMAAINDSGQSDYSIPTNVTTLGVPPSAPSGLTYTSISSNSVTIQWSNVSDASSYNVYLNGNLISNVSSDTYTLSGLTPNTLYTITINAQNTWGQSTLSSPLSLTTLPDPPTGLKATNVTLDSIALSWTPVQGAINYTLKQDGNIIATLTDTSYTVNSLSASTTYQFQVSVSTLAGQSTDSQSLSISTLGYPPVKPSGLSYGNLTSTSFKVYWTKQTDAQSYNIYLNDSFMKNVSQPLLYNPSYTFSGLNQNQTYKVTIVAVNSWGQSPVSDPLIVMTTLPPILDASVDGTNLNLTWKGSADAFLVYVNDQQVTATNANQYIYAAKTGKSYTLKVVGVVQGKQFGSNVVIRAISAIPTVGLSQVTNDFKDNVEKVATPIGGLLAVGLGIKASPIVINILKAIIRGL